MAFGLLVTTAGWAEGGPRITIEKFGCFGVCPSYTLTVYPDDRYAWDGDRYVGVAGVSEGELAAGTFKGAMLRLESVRYREFADSYNRPDECPEFWTDNPATLITVVDAVGTKKISHYAGCRGFAREVELKALEDSLDRLFHVDEMDATTTDAQ
jgi:hypothetical protein